MSSPDPMDQKVCRKADLVRVPCIGWIYGPPYYTYEYTPLWASQQSNVWKVCAFPSGTKDPPNLVDRVGNGTSVRGVQLVKLFGSTRRECERFADSANPHSQSENNRIAIPREGYSFLCELIPSKRFMGNIFQYLCSMCCLFFSSFIFTLPVSTILKLPIFELCVTR